MATNNTSLQPIRRENKEEVKEQSISPIKIAVIGATGAGKSQLCNLLCNDANKFEVNDDPDSCTTEITSNTFKYEIDGKQLTFQVIDYPGFFDTEGVLSKVKGYFNTVPHKLAVVYENIQKCVELKNKQISVFLFVVPNMRLTTDYQKSIEFMKDYFIQKASKHVMYVFSKSKGKT
eukprot:870675_1